MHHRDLRSNFCINPFLLASDHETRVFIFLSNTGHMFLTVSIINHSKQFFIWDRQCTSWGQRWNKGIAKRQQRYRLQRIKYQMTLTASNSMEHKDWVIEKNKAKERLTCPVPVSFSSCCFPILLTVKLVVAARRPPRTCSWDWALLLAREPGSSAEQVSSYWTKCADVSVQNGSCSLVEAEATYWSQVTDRSCSCCGASSRCWQPCWGRCFYCYCDHTPASPHQGPETEKTVNDKNTSRPHTSPSAGRPASYHLEGNVLWWTEFDTFIDKSVEVALADVGRDFGSKLSGYDGALQRTTLQIKTKQNARLTFPTSE